MARVIGVSPDSAQSHLSYIENKKLPFGLISDPKYKLASHFGSVFEKRVLGFTVRFMNRYAFIIDQEMKLENQIKKVRVKSFGQDLQDMLD